MASTVDSEQVRAWLDDELVGAVETVPDEAVVFNLAAPAVEVTSDD